jgi:hypothetical protein
MFPWLWLWAPQVHFPWSGSVAQQIAPDTDWFFAGIEPRAGDARIERRAFGVATYGKQLGLITEVLLALAEEAPPASKGARESIARLKKIRDEIERIKVDEAVHWVEALADEVRRVQQQGGAKAKSLQARLAPLLLESRP